MIAIILICFISGIIFGFSLNGCRIKCLNSPVVYPSIDNIKCPKFNIIKIEEALDTNHNLIAKYTVDLHFFAKKNCKDWKYNKFYFYDNVGKYKIGDVLTFNKID